VASHSFSPVTNKDEFHEALMYVAREARKLLTDLANKPLPMESVRLFAHTDTEYKTLETLARTLGTPSFKQPAKGLYVDCVMRLGNETVHRIGIRPPDSERREVGHADFIADDWQRFVAINHNPEDNLTRLVPGREDSLFEMRDPERDVLVYVTPAEG
jgi:hypothetical protein